MEFELELGVCLNYSAIPLNVETRGQRRFDVGVSEIVDCIPNFSYRS
jgi:hypothetical protein